MANKYDSYSICHIQLYLDSIKKQTGSDVVYWVELKEALEVCNMKKLAREIKHGK